MLRVADVLGQPSPEHRRRLCSTSAKLRLAEVTGLRRVAINANRIECHCGWALI
ncbi:hypothetical protein RMSM_07444 [Rhodopirellula maiorica SM1]|uniref:Uncharacterized protein n=1 Tax=Rhodopirellula maiorica SM1 TaxID=1265738 RepID=M5R808_9BACT|nr:hypothetical protein RMSM_07444 [Rhodopirellula maiorica SM1]